jgi:hypothetical protein
MVKTAEPFARELGATLLGDIPPEETKALFVYIGLHPELFRLIKVYIN